MLDKIVVIKRDIDAWVVSVNGKVHPKGTGFPTWKAAKKWAKENLRGESKQG